MCSSILHIVAIIFFFTALGINLVAIATPGWIYTNAESTGLFQSLTSGNYEALVRTAAENVVFAFSLMADVLLLAALIVVAVGVALTKEIAKIGGILGIIAALFILIGMAAYTGLKMTVVQVFGYSFAIGWGSCVLALIGGIAALFA